MYKIFKFYLIHSFGAKYIKKLIIRKINKFSSYRPKVLIWNYKHRKHGHDLHLYFIIINCTHNYNQLILNNKSI